jgi:hypothetical protein
VRGIAKTTPDDRIVLFRILAVMRPLKTRKAAIVIVLDQ